MINLLQIQKDVHGLLMSSQALRRVNILLERKFIVDSQTHIAALWETNRNGGSGCGILIEQPGIETNSNNVSGPPQIVVLTFVSVQNGDAAFATDEAGLIGSGLYAEEMEQFILDALHLQAIGKLGTIQTDGKFSEPARDYPELNARRLTLKIKPIATAQTNRTAPVLAQIQNGVCTLTCATPGSKIVYTLDGSMPSDPAVAIDPITNAVINPLAKVYLQPFAVQSGETLRAAAYAVAFNPGEILSQQIP